MKLIAVLTLTLGFFVSFAQLSEGEGSVASVPNTNIQLYLPNHFVVKEGESPGAMHHASGTFIVVVKVPENQSFTLESGLPESFFSKDSRMNVSLVEEKDSNEILGREGRLYFTKYQLIGYEFERLTLLMKHEDDHYLVIGNYAVKLKDQVEEEVIKVMQSVSLN